MQHFPTHELHISALEVGKRGSELWPQVRIIHLEWHESTTGEREPLLKNLAKLWVRNLNRQQKTFRWRLFNPSTAQDRGITNEYAPSSRTLGMSQLTHSTYGMSNMLCTRYLQGVNIWRNSWSTEPQFKLCSRTSKSLSLGGVDGHYFTFWPSTSRE